MNDIADQTDCPACSGIAVTLGTLGHRVYFRCQACGLDSSFVPAPPAPEPAPLTEGMEKCLALIAVHSSIGMSPKDHLYPSDKRLNANSVHALRRRGLVEFRPGEYTLRLTHAGFCYIPKCER